MCNTGQQGILDSILTRAADSAGDITAEVLSLFYQRFPDARNLFYEWDKTAAGRLEAEMVSQVLYCLMHFADRPIEIGIIVRDTVPYHRLVLEISPDIFLGLIDATWEVIWNTIPPTASAEVQFWTDLQTKMRAMVGHAAKDDWTYKKIEKSA